MKYLMVATLFLLHLAVDGQSLRVSDNGRYLERQNGQPFFWLGDTAWELFHRLSLEEATEYLENRAAKGFTVVQAVVLAQLGGLTVPNANGDLPLADKDPTRPVEAYFEHVDQIVTKANELGIVIGMLPTWGSYWTSTNRGDLIFTPTNARQFGDYLGSRYRDADIVWILGGDENINNQEEREIIEAMAAGLKDGDGGRHLRTYHPRGPGRSSDYFHTASWLDFNMYQSSHAGHDHDNGLYAERDLRLDPVKPTLDGEPRYELIPVGFYFSGANRLDLFDDNDCRQAAYWSVLAGACGHTYGHNSIWQMWSPDHDAVLGAVVPWSEAIDHPGSFQMTHLRRLFEARPFHHLRAADEIILEGRGQMGDKVRAALSIDASYAIIYSPSGSPFTVNQDAIQANRLKSIWFDPRYGISHAVHSGNTFGIQTYTPPTSGRGNDWILILEDAEKQFPLP